MDPAAGLPFNLTLSDKEKVDRSQVKLPYKYTETQKANRLEGRVFYEPDAVDDWDDSDPDDDLDIWTLSLYGTTISVSNFSEFFAI